MAPRGLQDGPVVTMALPKPRGLGRGYRPFQQKLNTFLDPETQRTNHNHEPIFIRNTEHKTGRSYNLVSHSRDSRPIFEGLPRSSSMFALSAAQIRAQVPRDADTKSSQWRRSISQPHVACKSTDNGRMIGGRSMYGVATRIPMCWGDSVTIYVNRATCWIPIEFLEKVFNCPGSLLASSSTCCTRGFVFRPTNSVCYHCYKLIKNRFERYLSQETKPILNTLRLILDYKFKKESGLSLGQCDWHRCISDRQALL